ncbi:hypothetical protein [Salinihabitans flavidus]|uniref:hypothetical protein n=1 Tax=Salinihabitans flavidus TaxID=569882 RepID=UPI0015871EE4
MALGRARLDDQQEYMRIAAFPLSLAMADQNLAGEPDQVIGMMGHIGDYRAGLT